MEALTACSVVQVPRERYSCSMSLDFTPLRKALDSLDRSLIRWRATPSDEELRDACIQRFEYCFELAWKMIKRQAVAEGDSSDLLESMSKRGLFRMAAEKQWIDDPLRWFDYQTQRNKSSHTYDLRVATEVASVIPSFREDARALLQTLEARGDA